MFNHYTVLKNEVIENLQINPDGIYVDCTLGGGGHSSEVLKRLTGTGKLYCFDQDEVAIKAASQRLSEIGDNFEIIKSNFAELKSELASRGINQVDGIIYDLGVSSPQFDDSARGFSYRHDARLDMRMDQSQSLDAYEVVNTYSHEDLSRVIYFYGDEKFSRKIASAIIENRPVETTFELVEIIKDVIPHAVKRKKGHPAKKTFQAIRIEVNKELEVLEKSLADAMEIIKDDGRICVISFHSLEDKLAMKLFSEEFNKSKLPKGIPTLPNQEYHGIKLLTKKPILPTEQELEENSRSASAKLRVVTRV